MFPDLGHAGSIGSGKEFGYGYPLKGRRTGGGVSLHIEQGVGVYYVGYPGGAGASSPYAATSGTGAYGQHLPSGGISSMFVLSVMMG
jgi:hypothetical protein